MVDENIIKTLLRIGLEFDVVFTIVNLFLEPHLRIEIYNDGYALYNDQQYRIFEAHSYSDVLKRAFSEHQITSK